MIVQIHFIKPESRLSDLEPLPGSAFATVAVAPSTNTEQLAVPQLYPEGQHPGSGPASLPHMNQPFAQEPVVAADAPSAGTTIVIPPPFTMVVIATGGQLVV